MRAAVVAVVRRLAGPRRSRAPFAASFPRTASSSAASSSAASSSAACSSATSSSTTTSSEAEPDSLELALTNVRKAVDLAFEHSDPDDILRAKQLASNFIEKYTDSVRLLDAARQKHVHSVYGDRVDAMKADLLRLFRLRSFDG